MTDEPPEPPRQPPPLPPRPVEPLAYRQPSGLPMGVQALLGTMVTGAAIIGICFVAAFIAGAASNLGNTGFFTMIGAICVVTIGTGVMFARKLRRDPDTRGWAIGIYIGMGLAALFWGTCAMILINLR